MSIDETVQEQDIYGENNADETNYKIQFAMDSFKNIQELIRFIDQKAGAILLVYGIVLTVFLDYLNDLILINPLKLNGIVDMIISVAVALTGLTIILLIVWQIREILFKILLPRLALNYKEDDYSIFYFEHISHMKKKDLHNRLEAIKQPEVLVEIANQIFEVADIMRIKTYRIGEIIKQLFHTIVLLLFFILLNQLI